MAENADGSLHAVEVESGQRQGLFGAGTFVDHLVHAGEEIVFLTAMQCPIG